MDGRDSIQSLLVLRKLTRAIAETVRAQMVEYLTVLSPLLRPKLVLGDYVHGGAKEAAPRRRTRTCRRCTHRSPRRARSCCPPN